MDSPHAGGERGIGLPWCLPAFEATAKLFQQCLRRGCDSLAGRSKATILAHLAVCISG